MPKTTKHLLTLVAFCSATTLLAAQAPTSATDTQLQPAPIERSAAPAPNQYPGGPHHPRRAETVATLAAGQAFTSGENIATARPTPGILLRIGQHASVTPVSVDPKHTELRLDHGVVNLNVHRASDDELILVDLPGGQTHPLKDGLYTFNAETNTVRVLKGEAEAFPSAAPDAKPIKVKEDHAVTFNGAKIRSITFEPFEARADLVPYAPEPGYGPRSEGYGYAPAYAAYSPYGYGFYGGYGYPYYAYGEPFGYWGYPFGIGLGFGFYGGFGGGFGGFHGGGFRGHR